MPDAKLVMVRSIRQVQKDLERIRAIIGTVEKELDRLAAGERNVLAQMKEDLGEVHTRLEGLSAFVQACERRALHPAEPQDMDFWL